MLPDKQEKKTESMLYHTAAVVAGIAMMILGLGLGVTMVLLPIGIPLGLLGLVVLIGGLTPSWRT